MEGLWALAGAIVGAAVALVGSWILDRRRERKASKDRTRREHLDLYRLIFELLPPVPGAAVGIDPNKNPEAFFASLKPVSENTHLLIELSLLVDAPIEVRDAMMSFHDEVMRCATESWNPERDPIEALDRLVAARRTLIEQCCLSVIRNRTG